MLSVFRVLQVLGAVDKHMCMMKRKCRDPPGFAACVLVLVPWCSARLRVLSYVQFFTSIERLLCWFGHAVSSVEAVEQAEHMCVASGGRDDARFY